MPAAGRRQRFGCIRPQSAALSLLALFAMPAREAAACQVCLDEGVAFAMPHSIPIAVVLLGWVVAAFAFRARLKSVQRDDLAESGAPGWNAVVIFAWAGGVAAFIGAFTLTPHVCFFLLTSVWLIYLLAKIAAARLRSTLPPATRTFFRLNAAALAVSIAVIPGAFAWARQPGNIVSFIGNPINVGILRHVIAAGESAVPYLKADLDRSLRPGGYVNTYRISHACVCLARIGGTEAEQTLKAVVVDRVPVAESGDGRWQFVACCSYAECARGRAVPDLIRLYEHSPGADGQILRIVALSALTRTADREGVLFALDHFDDYLSGLATDPQRREVLDAGYRIAHYLIVDRDPELLRNGPLYGAASSTFGVSDGLLHPSGTSGQKTDELQNPPSHAQQLSLAELRDRWTDDLEEIRQAWTTLLK